MKTKTIFVILILLIITLCLGAWLFNAQKGSLEIMDALHYAIVLILVAFALIIGIQRLRSQKREEPAEDEYSKKLMQKASSLAYYLSLYLWLAFIFFHEDLQLETESLISTGILGMAILFAVCWFYYKMRGIRS
ncbi:MAG: hypothetical protein AMS23_01275 [Bacteroides sp. SM1_62]|nr:MAG: hypothetical protein AMS26_08575 [Bacteroides sp. SM23_62]KPL26592.1 MAG: hypothetical protein AMS23_01275 [Bacteroides sp. SM1_62]